MIIDVSAAACKHPTKKPMRGGFGGGATVKFSRSWLGNIVDRRSRKLVVLFGNIVAATAPLGYLFFRDLSSLFASIRLQMSMLMKMQLIPSLISAMSSLILIMTSL